jgi:putative membrane-bound dehydrogenase-like protein
MPRPVLGGLLFVLAITPGLFADDKPLPPDRSALRMTLPEGFRVSLVAAEPQLIKPIAVTTDDRGRLWVVESHSYPRWRTDGKPGKDRILIFDDPRGTGQHSCKVFWDRGTNLSGIAVGFGGVWLCASPHLLFIPVKPGEDKPAGPPVVVLDGWSLKAQHNVFNSLTWGPDGWLYGCNGILATSHVGGPGSPAARRVPMNCGVWRYHPTRKRFEAVAWGTTNPWGLDFDDHGEMFITNCVIKHLFHVIPGAHYRRMYGQDLNPHCYGLMESCADHIHWAGGDWTSSRGGKGAHDKPGGGHAHAGAMVYLGDNWPAVYRNHIFMCNIHGNRINQDLLERQGSGYVAHHGKDFLFANDPWFRGLVLLYGPDGGVYIADWHDTGECHNYQKTHARGRIYKVTFGRPAHQPVDLGKLGDEKLVRLQLHKNDWWVRHACRLLQERAHAGKLSSAVWPQLVKMLAGEKNTPRKLRALWALYGIGEANAKILAPLLSCPEPTIRGWAVRLLVDNRKVSPDMLRKLEDMARNDKSAVVRLCLASALQKLPLAERWTMAGALAGHDEDTADANLPLMIWYGIEPLVPAEPERAGRLLATVRIALVRRLMVRRVTLLDESGKTEGNSLKMLTRVLAEAKDSSVQHDVLWGMHEALQGRRRVVAPKNWSAVYRKLARSKDGGVRDSALALSVLFGDAQALASLQKSAADPNADLPTRRRALQTLVEMRARDMLPLLRQLLSDRAMRGPALRGLAAFDDAETPALILRHYSSFSDAEKADAISTLASRPKFALALLEAMAKGKVPRRDLPAFTARQLLGFKDRQLSDRLNKVWGSIRPSAKDLNGLVAKYKALLTPGTLKKADRSHGRLVFSRTCANCHTLFDAGGKIGPDLTGSQRTNPDYILTKVLDPNAVVPQDYRVTMITTLDGRIIGGIIKEETAKTVTVQTPNEIIRLPKADIEERKQLGVSMMPEDQLKLLTNAEIRDLLAYLASPGQVPLPKGARTKTEHMIQRKAKGVSSEGPNIRP